VDAWIEVVEGARAGTVHGLSNEPVMIGRSEDAHVRLDPHADLSVSGRHALLVPSSDGWMVRDLGSTNGTWVNDRRLEGDQLLANGDRVRLGPDGPLLVFRMGEPGTLRVSARTGPKSGASSKAVRRAVMAVAGVAVVSGLAYVAGRSVTGREWERERAALESRMDSILVVTEARTAAMQARSDSLAQTRTRVSGLLEALQESETEVRSLRGSLQSAKAGDLNDAEVARLRQRLQTVSVALERQQLAASLDFAAIEHETRPSVAQIYVQTKEGVVTGTAFGVKAEGVLMTNRHVVRGPDGTLEPEKIGVQFSDSRQVWPAHIVAVSTEGDLALVQVERLVGTIPTVLGFDARADTLGSGTPVAMLGFPLGGRPPDGSAGVVRPLLTAGVISGSRDGQIEIQGYGEKGASGSPVVDRDGRVVGILLGGRQTSDEHTLLAVPASAALRLLGGR